MTTFIDKKISRGELPLWGSPLRYRVWSVSKMSLSKVLESSSLSWKKALSWTRWRNFSICILLNREFVKFYGYRNKIQTHTEDGFLCVGKRNIYGIVTTVLRLSSDESQVIGGPVNCSSFRCKWLKSLELNSWILVRIDCTIVEFVCWGRHVFGS